jgi:hypothetical protein
MSQPAIDFGQIREHAGSKHRGFEELVYQLIPTLEDIGSHEVVRHGTPDAGTEATVTFDDGSVWGWQAKYLFAFRSGELNQLDKSFKTALAAHPALARYTFVLPYDLPSARPARGKSARQRFDEAKARWEDLAASEGRSVEVTYVGESPLLNLLLQPEHAGRVRYWFDRLLFSAEWLSEKTELALRAAGPRYTPELNVELPIAFVFDGLGRTERFDEAFGRHVRALRTSRSYLSTRASATSLTQRLRKRADDLYTRMGRFIDDIEAVSVAGFDQPPWDELLRRVGELDNALDALSSDLRAGAAKQRERERKVPNAGERPAINPPSERTTSFARGLWQVEAALHDVAEFVRGDAARLVDVPRLFLTGAWGTGKTHLLCDVAERRNADGRPTVILLGQQISAAPPWPQLLEQLGLANFSAEEFLGALDTAAETTGRRALLIIDAINEGKGAEVWPGHLRSFLARVAQFPRVALVMSCRDNYLDAVLPHEPELTQPEDLGFVVVAHQGFVGEESRAIRTFFSHFKLKLPDFPLLIPEFSNPLFLKLLCQALSPQGQTTLPRGSAGFSFLFNQFLVAANSTLARANRCNYRESENLVQRAVAETAQVMLDRDEEWISIDEAERLTQALLPDRPWNSSLLHGLIVEGVFAQNRLGDGEVVHFSYQRLSDHLRAARLIDGHNPSSLQAAIAELTADRFRIYRHAGLLEALAVLLPERLNQELHELVPLPQLDVIQEAFLASIIWRRLDAFPEGLALNYLNTIGRHRYEDDRVLTTLLHVACVPDHPFNVELLHRNLARRSLAERDQWWTTHINHSDPDTSVVYRIVDWALSEEQRIAADDAVVLCATTLAWFLTASDRPLRDKATKALVNLLRERANLVGLVLSRFREVDDPYVSERLYAAAYGVALAASDASALGQLAAFVFAEVFADREPPVHLLLRDYARGVIEAAAERNVLPHSVDLARLRPPYTSPWPLRPPSQESLAIRAPISDYSMLRASLTDGIKDFAHYTVGSRVGHFEARNQAGRRRALRAGVESGDAALPNRSLPVPSDEAARWIFRRVLELGWTPQRFKEYDEHVKRLDYDRTRSRVERIGKKYQWIALYELLARLADHCQLLSWWNGESPVYDGPWQIGARDADPSLIFEPTETPFDRTPRTWWAPIEVNVPRFADSKARNAWVVASADLASLEALLEVGDATGARFLVLQGYYGWREEVLPQFDSLFDSQKANFWLQIRSYFVSRDDFEPFCRWARERDWMGRWMPEGFETHEVFLGEWPWHPAAAEMRSLWRDIERREGAPGQVAPTSGSYSWSAEGDDSVSAGINACVPSAWLIDTLGLRWRARYLEFQDQAGRVVALDPSVTAEGPTACLVRADAFQPLLDDHRLALVWTFLGERLVIGDRFAPRATINGVAFMESSVGTPRVELWEKIDQ